MEKLVNMLNTPAEAQEENSPSTSDAPAYPWGLCITLNDGSLEKLGVKALPAVGTEVTIVARATVSRTSANATEGGDDYSSVDLQITDMQVDGLDADLFGRAAEMLYGKNG